MEFEGQGNNNSLTKPLCKAFTVQVSWTLETVRSVFGKTSKEIKEPLQCLV